MQRRFKITVAGHDYDVLVEEITDESGSLYPDRGTMRAVPAEASRGVTAAPLIAASERAAGSARPAGPGDVVSPLAGVVQSIDVELGALVEAGTRVVTLEAMKTKTMVAAGRAGRVSAIAVSAGKGVEAGQTLLTIA